MTPQLPSATIWERFPEIAIVILVLVVIAAGVFLFLKWAWSEYSKERDKDRAWREEQNKSRQDASDKQNLDWQTTVNKLADRWQEQDKEREGTLKAICDATSRMLDKLDKHDERAQRIERFVEPKKESK